MFQSLCEKCELMREIVTPKGSRFLLCELSRTNVAFAKYPPQPVQRCNGFRARDEQAKKEESSGN